MLVFPLKNSFDICNVIIKNTKNKHVIVTKQILDYFVPYTINDMILIWQR